MLGCIQPMSSPMMKRMLGFCCCCAAAGALAAIAATNDASRPRQNFLVTLMASFLIFCCPNWAGSRRPLTIAATFRRDDVEHPALRLEAQRGHASLVGVGTLHVLAFSTRKLTVSLVDAPVYRRIPCSVLLGCLLGRCLRGESGSGESQCRKEKLICVAHGLFPQCRLPRWASSRRPLTIQRRTPVTRLYCRPRSPTGH